MRQDIVETLQENLDEWIAQVFAEQVTLDEVAAALRNTLVRVYEVSSRKDALQRARVLANHPPWVGMLAGHITPAAVGCIERAIEIGIALGLKDTPQPCPKHLN